MIVKQTEIRGEGANLLATTFQLKSPLHQVSHLVSQSSNYEEERRNKLRGRKKEFPTEVTAFMSPCLNQMANLSFFWELRYSHLVFIKKKDMSSSCCSKKKRTSL